MPEKKNSRAAEAGSLCRKDTARKQRGSERPDKRDDAIRSSGLLI